MQFGLAIRRDHILEDSFLHIMKMKSYQMRQRWRVSFVGEPGLDAGGVLREWLTVLFGELFHPSFGLFVPTVGEESSYWINTYSETAIANSSSGRNHLDYFAFAGRLIGKAILEEQLVNIHLALPFLKHILGVPTSFTDLQFLDDEIYKSSMWIKRESSVDQLGLDFTVVSTTINALTHIYYYN